MAPACGGFLDYLRASLPVAAVASVPEIRLHQAGPQSGLRRWAETAGSRRPPYWARPWGGGLALARFVLDEPHRVAGRTVVDLGTGSGLVAIAAALAGAARVVAIDIDPHAVAAAQLNAAENGVTLESEVADPTAGPPPACDLVLVGDLFYAPRLARRVAAFLERCVDAGRTVLVGDPGRTDLPRDRLTPILSRPTPDFGGAATCATVYAFPPPSADRYGRSPRRKLCVTLPGSASA